MAKKLFYSQLNERISWSCAVQKITNIPEKKIINHIEKKVDKARYITTNPLLVHIFKKIKIKDLDNYILTNSTISQTNKVLPALGLTNDVVEFKKIFTIEDLGYAKPHKSCFRKVLLHSGYSPDEHLMIGDNLITDIIPAKEVGMKTCHIYALEHSKYADISLRSLYDLGKIFSAKPLDS